MKTKFFFAILLSISLQVINAQSISGYGATTGIGNFSLNQSAFANINKQLGDKGFSGMPLNFNSWTLDYAHGVYNNFVFNAGVDVFIPRTTSVDSSMSKSSGWTASFATGYLFHPSGNLFIYPMVGVDFGGMNLHSHYLGANKAMDVSASNNFRGLDCSINFDILTNSVGGRKWKDSDGGTGAYFTISAGYLYCPSNSYWNNDNFDSTTKPAAGVTLPLNVIGLTTTSNLSMLYVKVKFGIGYFSRN